MRRRAINAPRFVVRDKRGASIITRPDLATAARSRALTEREKIAQAKFEQVQENIARQREALRTSQPHGLTPSSRWSSFSGQPLPAGTRLAPALQSKLNAGKGVIARWSPEQQLWISAI